MMSRTDGLQSDPPHPPPGWVLRIAVPLQQAWEAPLYDGATIGCHASCSIILREEGVRSLHATIERDHSGSLTIRCEPDASLTLPDGSAFPLLTLAPGLTFRIGDCAACRVIHHVAPVPMLVRPLEMPASSPSPTASAAALLSNCSRCGTNLASLAPAARFCPRCGRERSRANDEPVDPDPKVAASAPLSNPAATIPYEAPDEARPFHSVMLLGYGNAMTRLGRHYAAGFGVYRNDQEAVRCFFKAAQLGNEEAQQHLARRGLL